MDYIVSGVNPARMVTSFRRPGAKRNAHPLRGEVVEVVREGAGTDEESRNRGGHSYFGYASGGHGLDDQARVILKVRTNQDLSDLVGKLVVVTLAE